MNSPSRLIEVAFSIPDTETFTYRSPDGALVEPGCRVIAPFGRRSLTGYVLKNRTDQPAGDFEIKSIERVLDSEPLFGDELLALARWTSGMYMCSIGEALSVMVPGARRESPLGVEIGAPESIAERHTLSTDQSAALENITKESSGMSYLFGITGSGKTEVFLRIAETTLAEGRSIIYLVPEIALTHQLIEGLAGRFGKALAVVHSRLTPSQKLAEWRRIIKGEGRFVVGARSAVFAPVTNLGLIIIDEEHESSYKSGATPRYHARQVAMRRRSVSRARLVMGSATPSAEAYHLMSEGGIARFDLNERLSGGAMPHVTVVDMKQEKGALSKPLVESMRETVREKRQIILFLNRRGFSYFFHCRSCGFEMTCRHCAVSLTYHKSRERLICHYCGYTARPVEQCPDCGSVDVGYSGFGTELIEEEVKRTFPDLSIRRIDTDSVRKKGVLEKTLDEFRSGEIDILLGTQMVAKGLNFPGVKLVGIVLADTGLHLPDFRSQERTFSLIVQVSGRAGRFIPDGEVIIQTYMPQNDAIRLAARADLSSFYERELEMRKLLCFPPFSRIIRLVFRAKSDSKARASAGETAQRLGNLLPGGAKMLGPAECPLSVIAGNHRYQLLIRTTEFSAAHSAVSTFRRSYKTPSGVYIEIDVDPVSLL
jgi:primosomal protein N' (replication factor Y) (superfamily II helicase)